MPGVPGGILLRCSVCPEEHFVASHSPSTVVDEATDAGWQVVREDLLSSAARHRCPTHRRRRVEPEDEDECTDEGCTCRCHD